MIIGRERKAKIEARLLALRHIRIRTKPLDRAQRWPIWRRRIARSAGIVALIVLVLAVIALCIWPGLAMH